MIMRVLFRLTAWLLLFAIAAFTLSPIELRPVTGAPPHFERFAAFAAVGGAFCLGYPKHRLRTLLLILGTIAALEAAQNFVPGRHGRVPDALMKASGALLGTAVVMLSDARKRVR